MAIPNQTEFELSGLILWVIWLKATTGQISVMSDKVWTAGDGWGAGLPTIAGAPNHPALPRTTQPNPKNPGRAALLQPPRLARITSKIVLFARIHPRIKQLLTLETGQ